MNSIAVVTCVWQRPERLQRTLQQLAEQTHPFDLHMIVNNPALRDLVDYKAKRYSGPITVHYNSVNRGPQARTELMFTYRNEYDYFMTIDDDAEFGKTLVEQWWDLRDPGALQGWSGFKFTGNYWQRKQVLPGEECHYLWGSNLFVPRNVVRDIRVLDLNPAFDGQCDDLWLCYHANHVVGLKLRAQQVPVHINIDGKDTYMVWRNVKQQCLEDLRDRGWNV